MITNEISSMAPAIANHLWQSTIFAVVVWAITLLLRRNPAHIRYSLWLAASLKFLLPFSLLIGLGGLLPRPHVSAAAMPAYSAVDAVGVPFTDQTIASIPSPSHAAKSKSWLPITLAIVWLCGLLVTVSVWFARWRQIARTLRRAVPAEAGREFEMLRSLGGTLPLLKSQELMEPGIFGILRPVLIWPEQLSGRLDDEHIQAILSHELMHAQRHDNLTAALHMLVEAVFWFHPLTWWIETRMVEERERACDEAVVQRGGRPEAYAESLLKACRFCVESPLPCVSGITGADLSRRVRSIMTLQLERLTMGRKILLTSLAFLAVAAPVAFGIMRMIPIYGQILHATGPLPSFEVASVRPWRRAPVPPPPPGEKIITEKVIMVDPSSGGQRGQSSDRVHVIMPISILIATAYNLPLGSKRILGGPDWTNDNVDQYEIQAKIDTSQFAAMQKMTPLQQREQVALMEQSLLADRFKLNVHFETREMPAYALILAKGGAKLTPAQSNEANRLSSLDGEHGTVLTAKAETLDQLVHSPLLLGGALIVDQTGLKGAYDFTMTYQRYQLAAGPSETDAPSLFTAIQEQLGLRLVPIKSPVEVIVIDHIEKPTEN